MKVRSLVLAIMAFGLLTSTAFAWGDDDHRAGSRFAPFAPAPFGPVNLTLASGRASAGQADPRVSVVPPGSSSQAAVVCSPPQPAWAGAISGSNWISTQTDCTADLSTGKYVYTIRFRLPSNFNQATLSGQVMADNDVTVQLNGNQLLATSSGNVYTAPVAFSATSGFNAGLNTLTFTVNNEGSSANPTGLDFLATVSANGQATVTRPARGHARGRGHRGRGRGSDFDDDGD